MRLVVCALLPATVGSLSSWTLMSYPVLASNAGIATLQRVFYSIGLPGFFAAIAMTGNVHEFPDWMRPRASKGVLFGKS